MKPILLTVGIPLALWIYASRPPDPVPSPNRPWEQYASPPAPGWEKTRQMFHVDEALTAPPTDTPTRAASPLPPPPPETP